MREKKIGFIGLGHMGHPMAKNLEKAGFPLSVYNRTIQKADDFKTKSKVYDNISDLVNNSNIIFTMLTNDQAVKAVYQEIIPLNIKGKLFVDMSTISQQTSIANAKSIKEKGASLIDAPVAGSTKPAADGTLLIMVGGEQNDLKEALPYLQKMGKTIKYLGTNGKGLAGKISINYFLSMIYQGLAETVLFSEKIGIDKKDMLEIVNESACGNGATKVKTPLLLEDNYAPAFALDLMLKDVLLAKDAGADYPLGKAIFKSYQDAHNEGLGQEDVMAIIKYLKA